MHTIDCPYCKRRTWDVYGNSMCLICSVTPCRNCGVRGEDHVDRKCLYDATDFEIEVINEHTVRL